MVSGGQESSDVQLMAHKLNHLLKLGINRMCRYVSEYHICLHSCVVVGTSRRKLYNQV